MKVRTIIGANAYAVIEHERGSLDVLLAPGRGAPQSLRETAEQWRAQADALIRRATLAERAAAALDNKE